MSDWEITDGTTTWTSPDSPFENLSRTLSAGGKDFFDFDYVSETASSDAEIIAFKSTVTVKKDSTQWFKGLVITNPRLASYDTEKQSIRVAGPMYQLSRCTFMQSWLIYDADGDENLSVNKSRVILNKAADGSRITTGTQIEYVINFAISKGIPITKGTIDTGIELPFDEQTNMTCEDVLNTMLRYLPDHVAWFDYSTTNPTFNCRKKSNLSAANKAITSGELLNMIARKDLQVPGVEITYEKTNTNDGIKRLVIETDSAGDTDAYDTIRPTFQLDGSSRTQIKAEIETVAIPDNGSPNGAAFKAYVRELIPVLATVADQDFSILAASRTGTLANYIVKGPVPDWVDPDVEPDEQSFTIQAAIRRDGDVANDVVDWISSEKFVVRLQTTDKETGTFTKTTSADTGEATPTGMAAGLFAAWNTLHYEGSFDYTEQEVDGACTPGKVFNITGGGSEINSKSSIIQNCVESIDMGTTSIRFGPPRRLEADTLIGLFRALRSRRYAWSKNEQSEPDVSAGSAEVSGAIPERSASGYSQERKRLQIINENVTDDLEHKITLDPSLLTFTNPDHKEAKELKPIEAFVLVIDGTGLSAKRVQMLACEPYGDPIIILPTGLTEGDLLKFGSTQLERLGIGSSDSYLKSNGTNAVWQTPSEC